MPRASVLTGILLALGSSLVLAQGGPGHDTRPFERIEQFKKVRMIEALDLNEEQSVRFFARLNEFDKRQHVMHKAKGDALDRIEQAMMEGGSEKDLEKLFPEVAMIDARMIEERTKFFESLTDVLSVHQRAKLLLFERKFEHDLRDALRETQKRRMRGDESRP